MKSFLTILFGGLLAILTGIGLAYGAGLIWRIVSPSLARFASSPITTIVHSFTDTSTDGTSISGSKRTIRYTASEEENLISSTVASIPSAAHGGVTADTYLVRDLTRGVTLSEHDADRLVPIASLTKLATAVVARTHIDPDERITVGPKIMATYGNTAGFRAGEVFKAADLMYPLLMVSSNDSAEAFALAYGRNDFIRAMNDWAQSIGAYRTYFADASGLSPRNVSTASDLSLMLEWIRTHDPEILNITLQKTKTVRAHTWINPTHFLSWSYYSGGKNGYTVEANRTSASLFTLGADRHLYAIVVLGSDNRDADIAKLLEKIGK